MKAIPKKYQPELVEPALAEGWESQGLYLFDESISRQDNFVVDTPPPTVSGALHIGHVFSYSHTDMIVRYQRMLGKNIMYPMGWDDNGLPTERRVQNKFAVRCNPTLPYDPTWQAKEATKKTKFSEISRNNFIESCGLVTSEDEKAFENLWRRLGLSVDWSHQYATIDPHCRKISQTSFLDLADKGYIYQHESPTMWDVDYQTALAQADIEDRDCPGAYYDIEFSVPDADQNFVISTTRPELLASCIAVVAHPDDIRYQSYFGKTAISPLFGAEVPICASDHADPEKGSGILMVCTFGDAADVDWWKGSNLAIKQTVGKDGRMAEVDFNSEVFSSIDPEKAANFYSQLLGKKIHQARNQMEELLSQPGSLVGSEAVALKAPPKPINHPVKFYEKGDRPVEFITTRQWFIKILDYKTELLEQGRKIHWHPSHMSTRYQHWVEGLNQDWCISRQRFFGVPFPVWYPLDDAGERDFSNPIFARAEDLPVDPFIDCPEGYQPEQRNLPGGFSEDPDVMDTWATSSLSPQLVSNWSLDEAKHKAVFPMDIRPQSHEIIRTWAFYTIAKAWMHHREIPWKNVVISGWILDPDRKKMSKSKGNVVTPQKLLDQYSSDAVRYWAARARLGVDTAYDESVFKVGRKLSTKLFNASRFVHGFFAEREIAGNSLENVTVPIDISFLTKLKGTVEEVGESFANFDYASALSSSELSFWDFCDNYLELVKVRAYGAGADEEVLSSLLSLRQALSVYLRMFAPVMPFITDEVWSWYFVEQEEFSSSNSIHKATWPTEKEFSTLPSLENQSSDLLELSAEILTQVRTAKSDSRKKLKWPVNSMKISAPDSILADLKLITPDIINASNLLDKNLDLQGNLQAGDGIKVELELAVTDLEETTTTSKAS